MKTETSNAIQRLHKLLQQVAAEVAAIRPLLEEEAVRRDEVARRLDDRVEAGSDCPATEVADLEAARRADLWADDVEEALSGLDAGDRDALAHLAPQAELAAWMLANRSTVWELSSDDDSRVYALVDAARSALPHAPVYALDGTARAVLALPADVAYPVVGGAA